MRFPVIILLFFCNITLSQSLDINTKKGYAANGYDVVAFFNNEAIEGNKNHSTTFEGVTYKFSSAANLNTFIENPVKYVPQYGGYCAYAVALKSDKVSINPKTFLIVDEKLYLFYNAWGINTLKLWLKEDQGDLIKKADGNWENIKTKK